MNGMIFAAGLGTPAATVDKRSSEGFGGVERKGSVGTGDRENERSAGRTVGD